MREKRAFLRNLLARLLSERPDADMLYIPRSEAGMRRMIRHLLSMRAPSRDEALERDIAAFEASDREETP